MIDNEVYITRYSAWQSDSKDPELEFTDSLFRRRLSQISKITIQVVHDILPIKQDTKIVFVSFRGELAKQYKINKMVIQDNSILPAAFSLSVFNAPVALACMALNLKGGYSTIYPGGNSFAAGLTAAKAALLASAHNEIVFVYADENPPAEYDALAKDNSKALAFCLVLTKQEAVKQGAEKQKAETAQSLCIPLSFINQNSPKEFLNGLQGN